MLTKQGFPGGGWHSHAYTEDGLGPTTRNPPLGEVRNLLYPDGFEQDDDGGLSVVRGGHLHRTAGPVTARPTPGRCAARR